VSIVMGLDQHRGQITAEWIDTETGEVQRTRVAPADRAHVRKWLSRFRRRELEVALEATTGTSTITPNTFQPSLSHGRPRSGLLAWLKRAGGWLSAATSVRGA